MDWIAFPEAPPIGTTISRGGIWELIDWEPYTRADGEASAVLVWEREEDGEIRRSGLKIDPRKIFTRPKGRAA